MRVGKTTITVDFTEELESPMEVVTLDYDVTCHAWPGEPMVMYDRNGDGYPGSPAELEVISAICTFVHRENGSYRPGRKRGQALGRAMMNRRDDLAGDIYTDTMEALHEEMIADR